MEPFAYDRSVTAFRIVPFAIVVALYAFPQDAVAQQGDRSVSAGAGLSQVEGSSAQSLRFEDGFKMGRAGRGILLLERAGFPDATWYWLLGAQLRLGGAATDRLWISGQVGPMFALSDLSPGNASDLLLGIGAAAHYRVGWTWGVQGQWELMKTLSVNDGEEFPGDVISLRVGPYLEF